MMTDAPPPDLGQLQLDHCLPYVGQSFVRANPDGPAIILTLDKAERERRDPTADQTSGRPFSLLFRGPGAPCLSQGMHDLQHAQLPLPGIFLVQVAGDQDHALYQAVFT